MLDKEKRSLENFKVGLPENYDEILYFALKKFFQMIDHKLLKFYSS